MGKRDRQQASSDQQSEHELEDNNDTGKSDRPRRENKKIERVRVWWPPTRDKNRTGFSGAYWPATVHKKGANFLEVEYDNGEREKVDPDNIFPFEVPIAFGKETIPLEAGEFVEVSNNSKTDPCAWLGCVATVGKKCLIDYPFHDSPSEYIKPGLLRRARVWDDLDWKFIEIGQKWKGGEVTSPIELNLLAEKEYLRQLSKVSAANKKRVAASPGEESEESEEEDEDEDEEQEEASDSDDDEAAAAAAGSSEEASDEPPARQPQKRGRPRKSSRPTRSSVDQGSTGTGSDEKKTDKPQGAKKRKPSSVRQA